MNCHCNHHHYFLTMKNSSSWSRVVSPNWWRVVAHVSLSSESLKGSRREEERGWLRKREDGWVSAAWTCPTSSSSFSTSFSIESPERELERGEGSWERERGWEGGWVSATRTCPIGRPKNFWAYLLPNQIFSLFLTFFMIGMIFLSSFLTIYVIDRRRELGWILGSWVSATRTSRTRSSSFSSSLPPPQLAVDYNFEAKENFRQYNLG